jgi:sulfate adenylyltransferase
MKSIYIDKEAVATLVKLKKGLFAPVTKLMGKKEAKEVDKSGKFNGTSFPFSFMLAPSGHRNEKVLNSAKKGDKLSLVCDEIVVGSIRVGDIFKIDRKKRVKKIYGTDSSTHKGVQDTLRRLGNLAICGEYEIHSTGLETKIDNTKNILFNNRDKKISSIMLSGQPFHRVHEKFIRNELEQCDILVIFLLKPYKKDMLEYEVRHKMISYFIDKYLPKDRVLLVALENTYIFAGLNEMMLNAIVAQNYGCHKLIVSQNHAGLGVMYDKDRLSSIIDTLDGIDIEISINSSYVYCQECKTLVSTTTCPHGSHNHIAYNSKIIMELFELGIVPPALLMRKELSAMILSAMHNHRSEKLRKIHSYISFSAGLIDDFSDEDFYNNLVNLHQTTSLT